MILHKYLRHLRHMDRVAVVHLDAVELALRLALEELAESIPSTPSMVSTPPTELATLQAELERLQTTADAEVAELKQQIAELDTDNAALIRRNKELTDALHIAQNGTGLIIKNPPFVPLPHVTADAPSTISNPPISNSMWSDPKCL
jgi:DNA-binding transcriptional MerR regulator